MSILIVEPHKVAAVIAYASKPEHWYRPGPGVPVPGDGAEHRLQMGNYRVVFTYTVGEKGDAEPDRAYVESAPDQVFRHLSISSDKASEGLYPSPSTVIEIARAFGFTGDLKDWLVGPVPNMAVIAVAQSIPELTSHKVAP